MGKCFVRECSSSRSKHVVCVTHRDNQHTPLDDRWSHGLHSTICKRFVERTSPGGATVAEVLVGCCVTGWIGCVVNWCCCTVLLYRVVVVVFYFCNRYRKFLFFLHLFFIFSSSFLHLLTMSNTFSLFILLDSTIFTNICSSQDTVVSIQHHPIDL